MIANDNTLFAPGRSADVQEHHLRFRREQSLFLRGREWERSKPVETWGQLIAQGIGLAVFMGAVIFWMGMS